MTPTTFRSWRPDPSVQHLVDAAYTVTVGTARLPVLPDGRAAIVWVAEAGPCGTLHLCGPVTRPWRPDRSHVEVTGVRLALGALPSVVPAPASTFVNRRVPLPELWGPNATARLHDDLLLATTPERRLALLQEALRLRCAAPLRPAHRHRPAMSTVGPRDVRSVQARPFTRRARSPRPTTRGRT